MPNLRDLLPKPIHSRSTNNKKPNKANNLNISSKIPLAQQYVLKDHPQAIIQSTIHDMIPKSDQYTDLELSKPSKEEVAAIIKSTKAELLKDQLKKQNKIRSTRYISYKPADIDTNDNDEKKNHKIIKIEPVQSDPIEPSRFKVKKQMPLQLNAEPVPILHSIYDNKKNITDNPSEWYVPPAISNWKNKHGYTIALDKRIISQGKKKEGKQFNNKFLQLTNILNNTEEKLRKEVEIRQQLLKKAELNKKNNKMKKC